MHIVSSVAVNLESVTVGSLSMLTDSLKLGLRFYPLLATLTCLLIGGSKHTRPNQAFLHLPTLVKKLLMIWPHLLEDLIFLPMIRTRNLRSLMLQNYGQGLQAALRYLHVWLLVALNVLPHQQISPPKEIPETMKRDLRGHMVIIQSILYRLTIVVRDRINI